MPLLATRVRRDDPGFIDREGAMTPLIRRLREMQARVVEGGGPALRQRHIERGKIPVRERIDLLVDPHSPFLELSPLAAWGLYGNGAPAAGIVTGIGIVQGVPVAIIANDATVKGGSFFHETVKKHLRAQEIAWENRLPVVYLVDCGGAYLQEQDRVFPDRDHFGGAFWQQCRMSAEGLPQIAAVFGGCTAGGAYIPALADEVVMVRGGGRIHLGGPPIVKAAINEVVDGETLGGAQMHATVSGVTDYVVDTEVEAIAKVRDIVATLRPRAGWREAEPSRAPLADPADLPGIVGADLKLPYDVREVIARLVDGSEFQEFKPLYGATLVCGFARIHGQSVGIVANNGVLFSESAVKGAHFIELCDQRLVPLLFLQNITGFMIGTEAERGGIAKHSAKLV
jgi:3-methylcrotonyl-CoA carboxylase beta subunit